MASSWLRRRLATVLAPTLVTVGLIAVGVAQAPTAAAADACAAPANPIVCENSKPGTPASTWDVDKNGDETIQGFATDMSVNVGQTESFKVKTSVAYTVDIYRLGYYGGDGARKIASVTPTARTQPTCMTETATHLIDCGNWSVSASWAVPADAVSGVYLAKITRNDTKGASHIPFVVRNDASTSPLYFQTSDTTWQAYNNWGGDQFFSQGANFYGGPEYNSNNRAYKISYNRPFSARSWENGRDYLFSNEYPMIRFMEENGYDVSYSSGIDTDRAGALLKNHKTFVTAGHDEYWSGTQRANVEAARDAGVNLAFFSGNDNYWKTRYEASTASTDSSSKDYRTLVCYKDTWAQAHIDPTSAWTGTWRDPRFSPPYDGGKPENALSGTIFMSNSTDLPITVSAEEGKLRIWRNTALATQAAGASTALAPHTVGYESNEDIDNGFRPAGLIDMSTTVGPSESYLADFGTATIKATTTHHITLYKAPSGSLVFSAGSVQWAWALDDYHDGENTTDDTRIQQATVNLFADMGAQPATLMSGLAAVSKSTDATKPTSVITSPAAGATINNGAAVTMTGTATDAGGGNVGGVEVSTDGGTTWHPAKGRGSWTYSFVAHGSGQVALLSRATDDSGNIETPSAGVTVTEKCPCTLYGSATPTLADAGDGSDVELGVKFTPTTDGYVSGVRFYKAATNTGTHTGTLWSSSGTALATGTFSNETASGWQTLTFSSPVGVASGDTYVASYRAPAGHYAADTLFYSALPFVAGPLTAPRSTVGNGNGVYANGGSFPATTYHDENYWVDPVFSVENTAPPVLASSSPRNKQVGVVTSSTVVAGFSVPVVGSTVKIDVKTAAGTTVAGATSYDTPTRKATFTPTAPFDTTTSYTVTVSGATSTFGVTMAPATWSFTTDSSSVCPCSLLGSTSVPTGVDAGDRSPVEVGVKFSSSVNGYITGVKFYKAEANTGTHTGTLWSPSGTALATGTFTDETATGWQTLTFDAPVQITAGTLYTASYRAPVGHYSADSAFYNTAYSNGTLTAPAGSNGVYTYGAAGTVPTSSFGSANYWVDPLFEITPTPPSLGTVKPVKNATGVGIGTEITGKFAAPVKAGTAQITVKDADGNTVPGSGVLSADRTTVSYTPTTALAAATVYTVTVSGATSAGGTQMTTTSWSFTTAATPACPCNLFGTTTPTTADGGDGASVELGVKVTPANSGFITGIRFYKSAANVGPHTGTLWSTNGTALATGTFTGETATGWQTLAFSAPVAVIANTTYIASYYAPQGHYSADAKFFTSNWSSGPLVAPSGENGLFVYTRTGGVMPTGTYNSANYYVDVLFATSTTPPTVVASVPAADATGVSVGTNVTASFSVPVQAGTPQLTVTGPAGAVTGTTTLSADGTKVTFAPASVLKSSTSYSATVSGGVSTSGVTMTSTTWTFKTSAPATCPCSLFPSTSTPATPDSGETSSVELGVKFTPTADGYVSAVKFYKSELNTGTHTGTLWSTAGTALATGTFANETASGWQTLTFATPVAVTAGTTYVASYLAPNGHYSRTDQFFTSQYVKDPLVAPGPANGVYAYGAGGTLPASTYNSTNYWVDVVFSSTLTAVAPTVTGTTPSAGATDVAVTVTPTATFSDDVDPATITASVTPAGGSALTSTVSYDAATKTAKITPAAAFAPGITFTASITAKNTAGTPMDAAKTWTFTTKAQPAPSVASVTPLADATDVATDVAPTATFSDDVDPATITASVTPAGGSALTSTVSYDVATKKAKITPAAALASTTAYTVSITAKSTAGTPMTAPKTWTFTTKDQTPPTVTSVAPAAGATAVGVNSVVDAVFSEPVTASSIVMTLKNAAGTAVAGAVSYDATTRNARFTPTAALASATNYTATAAATDIAGNAMTAPRSWTFTSGDGNAPTITALNVSALGTSATVTWTTDEVSTSVVAYGTSATAITSTATSAGNVTAHSVTLAGLTAGVQYFYKVTSADPAGNSATAPGSASSFTMPGGTANDLALNKTVTASSSLNSGVWGLTKVVDGVLTSTSTSAGWTSNVTTGASHTEYVQVDLGSAQSVNQVSLFPRSDSGNVGYGWPVDFTIGVSTTGTSFTTVATVTGAALPSAVQHFTFTAASARYIRVTGTALRANPNDSTNPYRMQFAEIGAYGPATSSADTVAPAVSAVTAGGGGTTATVRWTTDEASSSTVQYGTSATALTSTGTAAGNVTAHSVALTGLTPSSVYYYRVVSADAAGNSTTAPAASAAPATWNQAATPPDTTPPTVTAVTAAGAGAASATVTWTTNEASTSVVSYGTSAAALTSTATGAVNVTAHSVTLTGLTAKTKYYYRVTSADAAGNSTTSPATAGAAASYAPTDSVVQALTADFTAGTQSSTYVSPRDDGDVLLAPALTDEFTGTALGTNWTSTSLATGSAVTVSGGQASVSGRFVRSATTYSSGRVMDTIATFRAVNNQWVGFASTDFTGTTSHWAAFHTNSAGALVAETRYGGGFFGSGAGTTTLVLPSSYLGAPHRYTVDWTSSTVVYSIDGNVVATQARALTANMYAAFRDATVDATPLLINSVWVTPYAASGTFTSSVIDAGQAVDWGTLTPTATIPSGTAITYQVRSGPNATPGGTGWSAFTTVAAGANISLSGRYVQYRATLTTNTTRNLTPLLASMQLAYAVA